MQLHKLRKHASELEWSGGRRGRAEAEGLRGSKRWAEKGKGGCTMTGAAHSHMEQHENEETSSRADDEDIPDCIFGSNSQHQDDTPTKPADDQMSDISGTFCHSWQWAVSHVTPVTVA